MTGGTDFFQGHKFFLRLTLCWKNIKWKVVPKKAQIWPCAGFPTPISTPESNSPRKNTSIKGLGTVFFGFLHKKCLAGRIFSEEWNFFYEWPYVESMHSRVTKENFILLNSLSNKKVVQLLTERPIFSEELNFFYESPYIQNSGKNLSLMFFLELYTVKALR